MASFNPFVKWKLAPNNLQGSSQTQTFHYSKEAAVGQAVFTDFGARRTGFIWMASTLLAARSWGLPLSFPACLLLTSIAWKTIAQPEYHLQIQWSTLLTNFKVYNASLLPICTMLYCRTPEHTHLAWLKLLCLLVSDSLFFPLPLLPGNHFSILRFYDFDYFRYLLSVESTMLVFLGLAYFT